MKSNVVKFEGTGKSYIDIAEEYMDYITNKDFNLTIDDACYYLSCTYSYFLLNFRDIFKHLYINIPVRTMINKALNVKQNDNLDISLIRKKILYSRNDFLDFLEKNLKVEVMYKTLKLENFKSCNEYNILENMCANNNTSEILNLASRMLFGKPVMPTVLNFNEYFKFLPERFISLNDLKSLLGYKHNIQLYRHLKLIGGNKYRLNNLVRYAAEDFNPDNVNVNFAEYIKYTNDIEVMDSIVKQGLSLLKR
ncbi:MAG: hypothetical protein N2645_01575 [Clostridia bacterium]|nr:hypothetical protein [Clostridia bacterium]